MNCKVNEAVLSLKEKGGCKMYETMWSIYFSPTGTTKKQVLRLADGLESLAKQRTDVDVTKPSARQEERVFGEKDLLILGMPVYAGHVPNKILPFVEGLEGHHTTAIILANFGNRSFDDALMEMREVLRERGFVVIAAAATVSRHSMTDRLAGGRPNDEDVAELDAFAAQVCRFLESGSPAEFVSIPGEYPAPYYTPRGVDGQPTKFLKATPKTTEDCIECGICAGACPMGSISAEDPRIVTGICIKCQACVRLCPKQAKYFDDPQLLSHIKALEMNFSAPNRNAFFPPKVKNSVANAEES